MRWIPALFLLGCPSTQPEPTVALDGVLLGEVVRATLTAGTVATEVGLALADPDTSLGACPGTDRDGDLWSLDYGAGCTSSHGTTVEPLSGTALFTVPAATSLLDGDLTALGPEGATVTGGLTGEGVAAGALFSADLTLAAWTWGEQTARALDAFVEVDRDANSWMLQMDGAALTLGSLAGFEVDADALTIPVDALAPCAVPQSGSMRVHLGDQRAEITFAGGVISAQRPNTEPIDVSLCP